MNDRLGRRPRLVTVRGMAAVVEDEGTAGAGGSIRDDLDLTKGPVSVVAALHDEERHVHADELLLDGPVLELRIEPGIAPPAEGVVGAFAVVAGEPLAKVAIAERRPRRLHPLDAARLVERVRGEGHHRAERNRSERGAEEGDGPAVAVPNEDGCPAETRFLDHPGQDRTRLPVHEVERPRELGRTRPAVTEAAVGEDLPARRPGEIGRPVAPNANAAKSLVKQDERCAPAPSRSPACVLDTAARRAEEA